MMGYEEDFALLERFELSAKRIAELNEESIKQEMGERRENFADYFAKMARYINSCLFVYEKVKRGLDDISLDELKKINSDLYADLRNDYDKCYANTDYAEKMLGTYGQSLGFLAAELYGLPQYIFDDSLLDIVIILELFLEIYGQMKGQELPNISDIEESIYYFAFDYIEPLMERRTKDILVFNEDSTAYKIIMKSDLSDLRYLYHYGEYISDDEVRLAEYMNTLSDKEIDDMARTYTTGMRRGFETMRVPFDDKRSVNIRYHLGQERMVKRAIEQFKDMGLSAIVNRYAVSRLVRKGVVKQGYESTPANMQFEYDHRMDEALFLDRRFMDRKLNAIRSAYEIYKKEAAEYAGPAVIETFGEETFLPKAKDTIVRLSDEQQKIFTELSSRSGQIANEYIPGDKYSFTIISYPLPSIGDKFEEIFNETVKVNNLPNDKYTDIQQAMIDVLDKAKAVRVVGKNGNETDLYVPMRVLEDPEKETQFENCVADVNIPVGEIFTSPVLKGFNGLLHVSSVYLNGYLFKELKVWLKDGVVSDYSCMNYSDMEAGKKYIKENILYNHETLPVGEFAIGTNTTAYRMAKDYDIMGCLPILIMEKTGPHFALGDTCYSHAEDKKVYNQDGKEIVSRENDFSILRSTDVSKAYFNCHTDITIPFDEIGRIYTENHDGSETDIIVDGRFVLPGTLDLNIPLDK